MPKIIQITKTTRKESFLALDDSGQLFAYSPEIAGLSVESWQRIPLLPEHVPPAPVVAAPLAPEPEPSISPDWSAWLSQMTRKRDWFTFCPTCKTNIQATDTETLRRHWLQGHFNFIPERGE